MIEELILSDAAELYLSAVNLGEVLCVMIRRHGAAAAARVEESIVQTPKIRVMDASRDRIRAAAKLKAAGGLTFADCFAAALAQELDSELVTVDPEFGRLERVGQIKVLWLD